MADKLFRNLSSTQVAQVITITITAGSTAGGATWTVTLTDDDGTTHTVTYTETGVETASVIAAGIVAAWNASTQPDVSRITAANPSGAIMTFTSDTSGRPISLSIADDSDGTHSGPTTSTANRGNKDYSDTANWPSDAIPTTSDDVVFDGSGSAIYGLNQSSVAIGAFETTPGFSGQLGRIEDGVYHYLRIDPDSMQIEGSSNRVLLNIGTAAIAPLIRSSGQGSELGKKAIYLLGSAMTTLTVESGQVGVAVNEGETATVATLVVGYVSRPEYDSDVEVGDGVTLTTVHQDGGTLLIKCAATTVNVWESATFENQGSEAITTMNVYGTAEINSSGTVGTVNLWGTLDARGATITTLNMKPGGSLLIDDGTTITTLNPIDGPGESTITRV